MKKWRALLLVVALVIANALLVLVSAWGFLGRTDLTFFVMLMMLWLVYMVADVFVTMRSASQSRWAVCFARILFAGVGVYVNLSVAAQISYVS